MSKPSGTEIVFVVEDDPEGGLVASALGHSVVTQAATLDALRQAVRDAVKCHFEESERPKKIRLHYVRDLSALEDAVRSASEKYEICKCRIADEWARMASVADREHGLTVSDSNRVRLESLVDNALPALRAERNSSRASLDAVLARLNALKAAISAKAQSEESKRAEAARIMARRSAAREEIELYTLLPRNVNADLCEAVKRRGIDKLVHFTRIDSLRHLPHYGLLSRVAREEMGISCKANDDKRFDDLRNHISLSIQWPNWQLFHKFQNNSGIRKDDWCVLIIDPSVIWTMDCLFTADNAASFQESRLTMKERQGVRGFERLFDDSGSVSRKLTRSQLNIADNMPTCPQAEVLVRLCVPWSRVRQIVVYSYKAMGHAKHIMPRSFHNRLKRDAELFKRRGDWEWWTRGS